MEQVQRTDSYATGTMNQTQQIRIDLIDDTKQMVRAGEDADHTMELAASISANGLLHPIVVCPSDDGRWILVAGYHRMQAAKLLNWITIAATTIQETAESKIRSLALTENIIRRQMTIEEECLAIKKLSEEDKMSVNTICHLISRSRAWVDRRIAAGGMPIDVQTALFAGRIGLAVAETIAGVPDDGRRQTILYQAAAAGWSAAEAARAVELCLELEATDAPVAAGLQKQEEIRQGGQPKRVCNICGQNRGYDELQPFWACVTQCHPPDETRNDQPPED